MLLLLAAVPGVVIRLLLLLRGMLLLVLLSVPILLLLLLLLVLGVLGVLRMVLSVRGEGGRRAAAGPVRARRTGAGVRCDGRRPGERGRASDSELILLLSMLLLLLVMVVVLSSSIDGPWGGASEGVWGRHHAGVWGGGRCGVVVGVYADGGRGGVKRAGPRGYVSIGGRVASMRGGRLPPAWIPAAAVCICSGVVYGPCGAGTPAPAPISIPMCRMSTSIGIAASIVAAVAVEYAECRCGRSEGSGGCRRSLAR